MRKEKTGIRGEVLRLLRTGQELDWLLSCFLKIILNRESTIQNSNNGEKKSYVELSLQLLFQSPMTLGKCESRPVLLVLALFICGPTFLCAAAAVV